MRKLLVLILFLFILCGDKLKAQSTTCAQTLRLAQATYDQGRLHEVPSLLTSCLSGTEMTKQQRIEAYKLLVLTNIYLEEPKEADEAMLNLLNEDNYFTPSLTDPAEFIALHKTFRTKPLFNIGFNVGPNVTFPTVSENYSVSGSGSGQGKYSTKINIQVGLVFEKEVAKKFIAAPEISLSNRTFTYTHPAIFVNDSTQNSVTSQTAEISQSWLDLNLLVQYKIGKGRLNSYVSLGPNVGALLSATSTPETEYDNGQVTSGSPIDLKSNYKKFGYSLIGTAGIKFKFGAIYLTANLRYQFGLSKLRDEKKKTNSEETFDYAFGPNIYSQQNTAFLIGVVYPIFKPKKLGN